MANLTILDAPNGAATVATMALTDALPLSSDYYAALVTIAQWITGTNVVPVSRYSGSLNAAIAAIDVSANSGQSFTIIIDCATTLSASLDLTSFSHVTSVVLNFVRGGIITFGAYDLTIRHSIPNHIDWQIFNYDSTGVLKSDVFGKGGPRFAVGIRPEWWYTPTWDGTDATAAIQAAVDFAAQMDAWGTHPGVVQFSCGTYLITDSIVVPDGKGVGFRGAGAEQTSLLMAANNKNHIEAVNTTLSNCGGFVRDLQLNTHGDYKTTTGIGIHLQRQGKYYIDNVICYLMGTCVKVDDCFHVKTHKLSCFCFNDVGLHITMNEGSGGNYYNQVEISNLGYDGIGGVIEGTTGILIEGTGAECFTDCEVLVCDTGIKIAPGAGNYVNYTWFNSVTMDANLGYGWHIEQGDGGITSISCSNCWASYNGKDGVWIADDIQEFIWNGGRVRENGEHGFDIDGGRHITISYSMIPSNSRLYDNTYNGIDIAADISNFSIDGNHIGNFGGPEGGNAWSQAHGINIATGTSNNFIVASNILTDPGSGKLGFNFTPTEGYDNYGVWNIE